LVFLWVPKVEKKNLGSIGLGRFKPRHFGWGVLVYLLMLVASSISGFLLGYVGLPSLRSLQPLIKGYDFVTLFGLFLTGTFLEEVFYRGYLIERMTILTRHRWVAAECYICSFSPTISKRKKSIWSCIVVHGINDFLAFLIFPLLI